MMPRFSRVPESAEEPREAIITNVKRVYVMRGAAAEYRALSQRASSNNCLLHLDMLVQ